MAKWEYCVAWYDTECNVKTLEDWLNSCGSKGWELCSMTMVEPLYKCIFKRKIED